MSLRAALAFFSILAVTSSRSISSNMPKISVHLSNNFNPAPSTSFKSVLLITSASGKGTKLPSRINGALLKALEWGGAEPADWWQNALSNLKPAKESTSTVDFLIPCKSSSSLMKVTVAVLPSICSRSNAPSRAQAVASVVKNHKSSPGGSLSESGDNMLVMLVPDSFEHAYAQACAVGRQFPLFSMKTSAGVSAAKKSADTAAGNDNEIDDGRKVFIVVDAPSTVTDANVVTLPQAVTNTIDNIRLAQRLVDMPPNLLHVSSYIEEAKSVLNGLIAKGFSCEMKIIRGEDLRDGGFGGLWGVGKASEHPPALVILSHYPEGTAPSTTTGAGAGGAAGKGPADGAVGPSGSVCLVGKGIVYDTGGLSIKTPTTNMAGMKMDMGGSAAVLGAFNTAVRNGGLSTPLHALLCLAENSVDERSTRPDDILTMLSGKTVEVNNVDAEGRLVLADGCNYAARYLSPAYIIDIATLTGAQMIATGKNHGALYCNDDDLEALAVTVGKASGDLTHPMPYAPEFYKQEFASVVADMKNSVKNRGNAQVSCAGQFVGNHIEDFTNNGGKWLHIDMAGCATAEERATGYGVALLSKIVEAINLD